MKTWAVRCVLLAIKSLNLEDHAWLDLNCDTQPTDLPILFTIMTTDPGEKMSSGEGNKQSDFSVDLLRIYYGRLFPYQQMFDWLSYGNDAAKEGSSVIDKDFFLRREWSFTIEDDIYIRYQCFKDKAEFMAAIQKRQPHKIDIGAVFSAPPKEHTTIRPELFNTVERELVFDVDMTDYDNIRTCCTGAAICRKCWPYMTMALKVVDRALREDFNFKHILWVYSGRRGVHCWVNDPDARALANEARAAVVEYLSVEVGTNENSDRKIKSTFSHPVHPSLRRAYDILEPMFEKHICDDDGQGLLATRSSFTTVLNSLPNAPLREDIYKEINDDSLSGAERWKVIKKMIMPATTTADQQRQKKRKIDYLEMDRWRYELVFTHCYPRLDANVSKAQNHLLKSPFCVHPKTGRVCVPIDPFDADKFDPFSVPTVRALCNQVDAYDRANPNSADIPDIDKTSLKDSIATFDRTFMNGLWKHIRTGFREKMDKQNSMALDF